MGVYVYMYGAGRGSGWGVVGKYMCCMYTCMKPAEGAGGRDGGGRGWVYV